MCRSKNKKNAFRRDYFDRETWTALQGECAGERELSGAEMERDKMIGGAMYEN